MKRNLRAEKPGRIELYASVDELRAEGIGERDASDERLSALSRAATSEIDRICGWWFEPRGARFELSGRGSRSLELPVPPIRIDSVFVRGERVPVNSFHVEGAPILPGFNMPLITWKSARRFPQALGGVVVEGRFGFTEPDGSKEGMIPPSIRRACMLMVLGGIHPLAHEAAFDARNRWRLVEEKTRDQSYKLTAVASGLNIDPEVEAVLCRYRRPAPLGAA